MHPANDTIVAVSSPPGRGWRGIVRLSGPEALRCAEGLFIPSSDGLSREATLSAGIKISADHIKEGVAPSRLPSPLSLTEGEVGERSEPGEGVKANEAAEKPINGRKNLAFSFKTQAGKPVPPGFSEASNIETSKSQNAEIRKHPHPTLPLKGGGVADRLRTGTPLPRQMLPGKLHFTIVNLYSSSSFVRVPAFLLFFPAPHSYTGEDVVELHTLSNPALLAQIVQWLVEAGTRPAEAGEFTRRAVLHGKLDLTRAEGVAAVISAQNDAELRAGQALLAGHLAARVKKLQVQLTEALALVEAGLDFVDEGVGFLPAQELSARVTALRAELGQLLLQPAGQERLSTHPRVAVIGRPNAGKSTLFNALLGRERAIASPLPGTTRDVLRGSLHLPDGPTTVELLDTAGMEEISPPSELEAAMHVHAERAGQTADAVVLVADLTAEATPAPQWLKNRRVLLAGNKCDLLPPMEAARRLLIWAGHTGLSAIAVSARTGEGLDDLQKKIAEMLSGGQPTLGGEQIFLARRHQDALRQADAALQRVENLLHAAGPASSSDLLPSPELLTVELHESLNHLGRMVGTTLPDDLLDVIFSRFCIGK